MNCCEVMWLLTLSLGVGAALVLGIYATIKTNENSTVSIECDMCRKLFDVGDVCDEICEETQ